MKEAIKERQPTKTLSQNEETEAQQPTEPKGSGRFDSFRPAKIETNSKFDMSEVPPPPKNPLVKMLSQKSLPEYASSVKSYRYSDSTQNALDVRPQLYVIDEDGRMRIEKELLETYK